MEERRRSTDTEFAEVKAELAELKVIISDLVDAWKSAKGFLSVIKWAAGLGASMAIIWASLHGGSPK